MKIKKLLYMLVISFALCWVISSATEVHAFDGIKVKAQKKSSTSVKLSWKKHKNVKKWVIKQVYVSGDDYYSIKTIKTIKKNVSSYTVKKLKKKQVYYLEVNGYKKKKGKYYLAYSGYTTFTNGLAIPVWASYYWEEPYSPTGIWLSARTFDGFPIQGFEVWRKKEDSSKYKKIKTVKYKKNYKQKDLIYMDKTVEAGCKYYYKIRTFGKVKKKKTYSYFSKVISRKAVNQDGIYEISLLEVKEGESLTISIKSDKGNADLILNEIMQVDILDKRKNSWHYPEDSHPGVISEWNVEGKWKKAEKNKKIKIKPGQTVSAKISCENIPEELEQFEFDFFADYAEYNDLVSYIEFPVVGKGAVYEAGDYYH